MIKGTRTVFRPCQCGCGEPVPPYISPKTGRVQHYPRFVPGHGRVVWARRMKGRKPANTCPDGTTRLHSSGKQTYRVVKRGNGRWRYEHREIMAGLLGRSLEPWEHVHHDNEDTL